jgi:hypothetical protein
VTARRLPCASIKIRRFPFIPRPPCPPPLRSRLPPTLSSLSTYRFTLSAVSRLTLFPNLCLSLPILVHPLAKRRCSTGAYPLLPVPVRHTAPSIREPTTTTPHRSNVLATQWELTCKQQLHSLITTTRPRVICTPSTRPNDTLYHQYHNDEHQP